MAKRSLERWKTYKNVFDEFTERNLFKLSSQGHFSELLSPISIGKEANIFTALKGSETVILKIYRLENADFNRMYDYIKYDSRFTGVKNNRRKVIFAWAQREYQNLLKAREAGVVVPTPITCLFNINVMELIGDNEPAQRLKDAWPKHRKDFFNKVIDNMKKLYNIGLVHGDLSEFNILNYNEMPVFIDLSHATTTKSAIYKELLERDVKNIAKFFTKIGLKTAEAKIRKEFSQ